MVIFYSPVLLVLVFTNIKVVDSLNCYSCHNIDDPSYCNNTLSCSGTEVCFLEVQGGVYTLGCANNQHCGIASGPGIVGRDLVERQSPSNCLECCSRDGCNTEMCKHLKPTTCVDDESVDCARLSTLFHICQDKHQASKVCPKFCNLCTLVDGNWNAWSVWSDCDVTCDKGTQTRMRTCTDPAPANGGLDCVGTATETKTCLMDACPVHGGWSQWTSWGSCSVSCGVGLQRRDRSCSNPYPKLNGDHCFGESRDDRVCLLGACVNGGWTSWGSWGTCSDSCGGGVRSRMRTCSNPRPSLLGRDCEGNSEQVVLCNKSPCPDHKVAFTVYGMSSETLFTVLKFPYTYLNSGGGYNTSTGRFTCKVPGIYHFDVTLTKRRLNINLITTYLKINGVNQLILHSNPDERYNNDDGSYSLSAAGSFHLNQNDYVYVYGNPSYFYGGYSFFSGTLIIPDN